MSSHLAIWQAMSQHVPSVSPEAQELPASPLQELADIRRRHQERRVGESVKPRNGQGKGQVFCGSQSQSQLLCGYNVGPPKRDVCCV